MTGPTTLQGLRLLVQRGLGKYAAQFTSKKQDWPPFQVVVQSPRGVEATDISAMYAALRGDNFTSGATRASAANLVKHAISIYGAYRYVVVINAHSLTAATGDDRKIADAEDAAFMEDVRAERRRLSEHPRAVETLTMVVGDAETEEVWAARIVRVNGLRRAGTWERVDGPGSEWTGRFSGFNELLRQHQRSEEA